MLLLRGHSLTPERKIPLESMSLRLNERSSTASMVPVSMDGIGIDSWFLDDTDPGKGIVWRVQGIQTAYATDTPTVQLEHVVSSLKDRILFGSYEASNMGGGATVTAEQALRFVLSKQSDWRLGRCEYSLSAPYKFDGESLYDAIKKITDTLDDAWWDLDTSVYPFVINIIRKPAGEVCEMRPGRNLSAVTKQINTSGMYTRFYPIGKDDLHIPSGYISRNESTYGVREKVEVDQELTMVSELISWANEKLRKHAQPEVTAMVEGLELVAATGESVDKLTLGRICRIPLTEFNTTIDERITQLEYPDKVRNKEKVRMTLSNQQDDRDILHLIADEIKTGGGRSGRGGRGAAKQAKEDHAWFEDTDKHVAMVATGVIGTDADGKPNWERLSRLEVNENGIYGEVKGVQNDVLVAQTKISQNENEIKLEAERAKTAEGDMRSQIKLNAEGIEMRVEKNGVISAINQTSESVTIQANKINLSGYVTTSQLTTTNGRIDNLMSGNTAASKIVCDDLRLPSAFYYHGNRYTEFYSSTEGKYLLGRS